MMISDEFVEAILGLPDLLFNRGWLAFLFMLALMIIGYLVVYRMGFKSGYAKREKERLEADKRRRGNA